MKIHPAWKTKICFNTHDLNCTTKANILYVSLCQCGTSIIPACNLHQFIVDPESKKYMCMDCNGIKNCPKCGWLEIAIFAFNIDRGDFTFLDEHIREDVALKFLQKDPDNFKITDKN